jgi:dienelactone hydrolase
MRRTRWTCTFLLAALGCAETPTVGAQRAGDPAPVTLFAYDRAAPPNLTAVPTSSGDPALDMFRIAYDSPSGGRVTGFMATPRTPGPHAGVLVLHGLPGTAEQGMVGQGREIARRGAVVIAIDAPWARRGGLPDLTPRDSADQVQLMRDLSRALDVLEARPDVDRTRLGYVGGSYGGAMGALFVGLERRLAAAVLFVPDGGLVEHFTNADGSPIGPLADVAAAARRRWLEAMWPIEPIRFIHHAAGTPILFQNGRSDALVTVEDAEALHAAAKEPKTIQWFDAGHGLTPTARAQRLTWLAERLALAAP